MLGCKSSRYLKSPFPKDHTIVRPARKWFVRRVFRAATVRERSRDCPPITYREFMQLSTSPRSVDLGGRDHSSLSRYRFVARQIRGLLLPGRLLRGRLGQVRQNAFSGRNRLLDLGLAVGRREESGLELGARQIDARVEHPAEELRKTICVAVRGGVEIRDRTVSKENGKHRAPTIDRDRDAGPLSGPGETFLEKCAVVFELLEDPRVLFAGCAA